MQKLCGKVAELLRKNPILWLPYITADLLASCLWQLRGLAQKDIVHWFTMGHSASGGDGASPGHDYSALIRALPAYLTIGVFTIVVVVCLLKGYLQVDRVSSWEREALDERPHALLLTAARKALGSRELGDAVKVRPKQF